MNPKNIILPIALMLVIVAGPLAYATATNLNSAKSNIVETQTVATQDLTADEKQINGVTFTPRWSAPVEVEADKPNILFADCKPNEFAVSGQHMFQKSDLLATQDFAIAWSDNRMSWLTVVENTGSETLVASNGVICAASEGGDETSGVSFDDATQTTINNIIKQTIKIENGQIINLNQVTNIYQNIVQNITQIINISNSTITNSTINQIANQSATQIIASNGTGNSIEQSVNQTAQQFLNVTTLEPETIPPGVTEEEPTLPINETSSQPELLMPLIEPEEETTEEPATPPATETETTETPPTEPTTEPTTPTEEETTTEPEETTTETTTEEPTSQIEEQEENPETVVE